MPEKVVKERPILFSAPMVLALLAGRKTQTRRVLSVQPISSQLWGHGVRNAMPSHFCVHARWAQPYPRQLKDLAGNGADPWLPCPYGKVGDKLWVRETFFNNNEPDRQEQEHIYYRADGPPDFDGETVEREGGGWRSSLHIPRWASRLTLTITDIRVQRLQEISEDDAKAEGLVCEPDAHGACYGIEPGKMTNRTALGAFGRLWNSIHDRANNDGKDWVSNPYIWALSFTVDDRAKEAGG